MLFKEALSQVEGFRYMTEWIMIRSEAGRRVLYETPFMTDPDQLEAEYQRIEQVMGAIWPDYEMDPAGMQYFEMDRLKDIQGTLKSLGNGNILGDIELFEIKEFALLAQEVKQLMVQSGLSVFKIADLTPVIEVLDPDHSRIPHFYIYDTYSSDLAEVRADMKCEKDPAVLDGLRAWEMKLEDEIRERLTEQLKVHIEELADTLDKLAHLDILVAKVEFARMNFLTRPKIRKNKIVYDNLLNIELWHEDVLENKNKYQPIDVSVESRATLVTGANMAGKSVLLKSLQIAQYLAQFGFFIPAAGDIVLVDEVMVSMGDGQDQQQGLSSFGAEMMKINRIIRAVKEGKKILALIDEPARTTNPAEGKAIVNALVDFLTRNKVLSVVTTHYDGITARCRRLRVCGLVENNIQDKEGAALTIGDIRQYMDYSLIEDTEDEVPHEALRVAELLGMDTELIAKARKYLKKQT